MRILRATLIATLALAAPASAAGPLAPGMPDRTFAGDGRLRSSLSSGREVAAYGVLPLASGRLAVLTSTSNVVRLRASGARDLGFGTRGVARVRFHGDGNDTLDAFAEDTDGALVVAGSKRRDTLAVRRLLPNGRVDRRFGSGGLFALATTTFVTGIDVAMAPDGTAFVAAVAVPPYYAPSGGPYRLLVTALDRRGRPVSTFGDNGTASIPLDPSYFPGGVKLLRLPDGRLRYVLNQSATFTRWRISLAGLTADGQPDTALGPGGVLALGRLLPDFALAEGDASGRLLLTTLQQRSRLPDQLVMVALTTDGARDPSFGTGGAARIPLPFEAARDFEVAVSATGDVAIAMTRLGRQARPAAALVRRDGRLARSFGAGGFATVGGFARRRSTHVHAAAVDGLDRLVLGGLSGDGLSDIRDDFGRDYVAMTRLRLRKAPLSLPSRATVSPKGVMRLRVGCRAAGGCRAALTARRGSLRRKTVVRMRAGTQRVVQLRLGRAGVRLASGHFSMRLSAVVSAAGRLEPLAVKVRLRRGG